MLGFRRFGQNFKVIEASLLIAQEIISDSLKLSQAIAEVIGTKSESHVRKLFGKNRKSQNLDSICRESLGPLNQTSNDGAKLDESIEIMEVSATFLITQICSILTFCLSTFRLILTTKSNKLKTLK